MSLIVTITGADDNVDPFALVYLSNRYPFAEFGVLFSASRQGTPRYPSQQWISRIERIQERVPRPLKLSAHLCGAFARRAQGLDNDGRSDARPHLPAALRYFDRVQVNGYETGNFHAFAGSRRTYEVILQARDGDQLHACARDARDLVRQSGYRDANMQASVLYDPSGGRGIVEKTWPMRPTGCPSIGYAGGIGPDSVDEAIRVARMCGASWIDMESGVRTDDRFDLDKVREVLERAQRAGAGA